MSKYIISCCSTADLSEEHFKKRNINYVSFHYSLDGNEYYDDLGKSIPFDEFYKKIAEGAVTSTSQVNADEFIEYFSPFLEDGNDILHVTLSTGLSGVYNSAVIAKNILTEKYPDRQIYIVDSLGASSGYGLLMDTIADKRDDGMPIEELVEWIESHKLELHHWFFSTDLTFYVKGGRISKAAGWFGTALNICPLLNMNEQGKLIPREKIRGKRKALMTALKKMEENADNFLDYSGRCFISHSVSSDDARLLADLIEERFHNLKGKVEIFNVGTTIGSHTGPGTIALFFWGTKRGE